MQKKIIFVFCLFVFFQESKLLAQVKILLLDGKLVETSWLKFNQEDSLFYYKTAKEKYRVIEKEYIYSNTEPNKLPLIVYKPDSILQYNKEEMFSLINGQSFARKNYHPYWALGAGLIAGVGGTLIPYSMNVNMFHSTFIPLAYAGIFVFTGYNKRKIIIPKNCEYPEAFKDGFAIKAQKRRFSYIALGTFIGTSIGYSIYSFKYH
jgi:hypothetical protein